MSELLRAIDNSFWKPGNYKKTTRRIQKGYALSTGLERLIGKRAQIEKSYATSLRLWSKKWRKIAESDLSYGTSECIWNNIADEGDRIADIHAKTNKNLRCNDWKRIQIFRKGFFNWKRCRIEERKEMEQLFKTAQKPYVQHLKMIEKAKQNYYNACKEAKIVLHQVRYALAENVKLIPPQVRRMQVYMEEADYKIYRHRLKYQDALDEMIRFQPKYIRNMTSAFLKCQESEKVKLQFYKAFLHSLHRTLNLTQNSNLAPIYDDLYNVIKQLDTEKDLKWWSSNRGIDMSVPQFIDCPKYKHIKFLENLEIHIIDESAPEGENAEQECKMEIDECETSNIDTRRLPVIYETETLQGEVQPDIVSLMSIDDVYEDCVTFDETMWSIPEAYCENQLVIYDSVESISSKSLFNEAIY